MADEFEVALREECWFHDNVCANCERERQPCAESDQFSVCFENMDARTRQEMKDEVAADLGEEARRKGVFPTRRDYQEYRADVMHASGETGGRLR